MENVRIAVVDDEKADSDLISGYISRYAREKGEDFFVAQYFTAATAAVNCRNGYDIIFMDVELPDGNGIDVIKKIREKNKDVIVVFVTNMAQFAVRGYEVRALDYVVKPVSYFNFAAKFTDALETFRMRSNEYIWISNKEGKIRLSAASIVYVEVFQHMLVYHTSEGDYKASGSLLSAQEALKNRSFSPCNRCYLVNLRYVTKVQGLTATVGGKQLQISTRSRSSFMRDLNDYLAGGGGGIT